MTTSINAIESFFAQRELTRALRNARDSLDEFYISSILITSSPDHLHTESTQLALERFKSSIEFLEILIPKYAQFVDLPPPPTTMNPYTNVQFPMKSWPKSKFLHQHTSVLLKGLITTLTPPPHLEQKQHQKLSVGFLLPRLQESLNPCPSFRFLP